MSPFCQCCESTPIDQGTCYGLAQLRLCRRCFDGLKSIIQRKLYGDRHDTRWMEAQFIAPSARTIR